MKNSTIIKIYDLGIFLFIILLGVVIYFTIKYFKNTKAVPSKTSCIPNCKNKDCGDNNCGGICGMCTETEICKDGKCVTQYTNCVKEGEDVFGKGDINNCPQDCCPGLKPCFGHGKNKNGYFCEKECSVDWVTPRCCFKYAWDYPCPERCKKYCDL